MNKEIKLCKCGCGGEIIEKPWHKYDGTPDYIRGHNIRDRDQTGENNYMFGKTGDKHPFYGKHHTDEVKELLRELHTGIKTSDETKVKQRKGNLLAQINDPTINQRRSDKMKGGNDIVGHHMIYDHSDLTKNIMPMTRSMHARLHHLFRKHGIEIPHINIKEEL